MDKTQEQIAEEEAARQAESDQKLNAVVKSHIRRELKSLQDQLGKIPTLEKSLGEIAEMLKKGGSSAAGEDKPDAKGKPDPAVAKLQQELEQLKRQSEADRTAREAVEKSVRIKDTRSTLKAALEARGVKGRKADAAVALIESEGHLSYDDEGRPILSIKRSRAKGAPAEALEFDDLAAGIEDWSKSDDAKEFLPAPTMADPRRPQFQQQGNGRRAPKTYDRPAVTDAEAVRRTAEQLEARGVNVTAILDE